MKRQNSCMRLNWTKWLNNSRETRRAFIRCKQISKKQKMVLGMHCFVSAEVVLTKMALRVRLSDMFDRRIEKLRRHSTFMESFKSRVMTSNLYVRPVASFDKAKIEQKSGYVHSGRKRSKFFHHTSPSFLFASELFLGVRICIDAMKNHKNPKNTHTEHWNGRRKNIRSSLSSSSLLTCLSWQAVSKVLLYQQKQNSGDKENRWKVSSRTPKNEEKQRAGASLPTILTCE